MKSGTIDRIIFYIGSVAVVAMMTLTAWNTTSIALTNITMAERRKLRDDQYIQMQSQIKSLIDKTTDHRYRAGDADRDFAIRDSKISNLENRIKILEDNQDK